MARPDCSKLENVIKFKVSQEESETIKSLAKKRNMSVSEYCRNCTLSEDKIPVVDNAAKITYYLSRMSDQTNSLSIEFQEQAATIEYLQREMRKLWQFLK